MDKDYENIGPPYVLLIEHAGTIFGIYCGNAPPETVIVDPPSEETTQEPST